MGLLQGSPTGGIRGHLVEAGLFVLWFVTAQSVPLPGNIESVTEKRDGSLSVLVIGDWGRKGEYNQTRLATQMGRVGKEVGVDFIISTGDNFYENGLTGVADTSFQESFSKIYTAKSLQKIWHSVLGNHDYRGDVLAQLNPVLRGRDGRWHCRRSFNLEYNLCTSLTAEHGCKSTVQFFFVDTTPFVDEYWEIPNEHTYDWRGVVPRGKYIKRQLQDLTMALKASTATWKIVVGHHPIRSVGNHGDTPELALQLSPILERYNVDLYINGHDHCLEHISSVTSPIQFLTSGGGSKAWRGIDKEADMDGLQFYYDGQGFLSLEISPSTLKAAFYDIEGKIIHQLNVSQKPSPSSY